MEKPVIAEYIAGEFLRLGEIVALYDDGRLHSVPARLVGFYVPLGIARREIAEGERVRVGPPDAEPIVDILTRATAHDR